MPEIELDQWGRYKLPHPDTGVRRGWTRCTTLAKTLDDMTGLHKWDLGNVVLGLAARPDLYALACATDPDDKKQLRDVVDKAKSASKADAKSHHGTAMHKFTERIDSGLPSGAPDVFGDELNGYQRLLATRRVSMSADYMERITVVPDVEAAGTMDRVATYLVNGKRYIADLKTGQDLDRGFMSIAMQLAVYAHGRGLWNIERDAYDPMPEVDQANGIVVHAPAGRPEDGELYWVDIAAGWEAAKIAYLVRGWRKRKDWAKPIAIREAS